MKTGEARRRPRTHARAPEAPPRRSSGVWPRAHARSSAAFDALVEMLARAMPLRAVVVVSRDDAAPPLVRVLRGETGAGARAADVALAAMDYLVGDASQP